MPQETGINRGNPKHKSESAGLSIELTVELPGYRQNNAIPIPVFPNCRVLLPLGSTLVGRF